MSIDMRQLQALLLNPQESPDTEIKGWLDLTQKVSCANLAKALIALANHGGGFILNGLSDSEGYYRPEPNSPNPFLKHYSHDTINNIIKKYAEPPFHCQVHLIPFPNTDALIPIIVVPGGHKTPIRASRNDPENKHLKSHTYYIRRPGPESAPPQTATEWDALISRCVIANKDDLLYKIRSILNPPLHSNPSPASENNNNSDFAWHHEALAIFIDHLNHHFKDETNPYRNGTCAVSYSTVGDFNSMEMPTMLEIIQKIKGRETGWPPWLCPTIEEAKPRHVNNMIECWIKTGVSRDDPGQMDYWLASPHGKFFLIRGYQEDAKHLPHNPKTVFDLTLPVWRIGECLLHSSRFAAAVHKYSIDIAFNVTWSGLAGRRLTNWAQPKTHINFIGGIAHQDSVATSLTVPADAITTALAHCVSELTRPLYAVFDFFKPPDQFYQHQLDEMTKGL